MDVQNILLWGILVGGLIYETTMWVYNKMTKGESFSAEKFALTYGYVALLAIVAYLGTGTIPAVADIISKLGEAVPDPTTVFTAASALVIFLYQQGKKILSPAIPTPPTETPPVVTPTGTTGGSGWQPDFSVVPTFPRVVSGTPIIFTLDTGAGDQGIHACKMVIIDWMDGSPLENVPMIKGFAQVVHTYIYVAGTSEYDAHSFFPEFTTVDSFDGAKKSFNTDGRACMVEVVSLIPAKHAGN